MMQSKRFPSALFGLAVLLAAGHAPGQATRPAVPRVTLKVGDPAPPLAVKTWLKGTPVPAFAPGQVYVVEFWATWCGPCKKSIPHLTELAHQYAGKASVIGVDVWERPGEATDAAITALAGPFVRSMGDQMDYDVAADDVKQTVATAWLAAAGQWGIPTAFVIDRGGRIAWIGHPGELGAALDGVTAGKWDVAAEVKREDAQRATAAEQAALMGPVMAARQAHDDKATLAALDVAQARSPYLAQHPDLLSMRLEALVRTDKAAAMAFVAKLTDKGGPVQVEPALVWSILRALPVGQDGKPILAPADYRAIADRCRPMVDVDQTHNAMLYEAYADVLCRAGAAAEAVPYQAKAVAITEQYNDAHRGQLQPGQIRLLQREQARLAELKGMSSAS